MTLIDSSTLIAWSNSPYSLVIMSILSFSESAFFVIPPEILMLPMALANPSLALWYALIVTITSVLGAMFGFFIGQKGGKPILRKLFGEEKMEKVRGLYQKYDWKAIFIAAFTPIPFKVFTVAAGAFDIDFKKLLLASIIGRGSRYFLLGGLIFFFGEPIRGFIENQLEQTILIGTVVLVGGFFLYKFVLPIVEQRLLKDTLKNKVQRAFAHLFNR